MITFPRRERPNVERQFRRVLLVDDDPMVRALVRLVLEGDGHAVVEAADASQAIEQFRSADGIGLLITDVVMPGMNGHALAETLRAAHPALQVLYISGHVADATLRALIAEGAAEFLAKPFSPEQLARKVRALLDSP